VESTRRRLGTRDSSIKGMLTPEELSSLLAVPVATVYRWRSRGEGPPGFRVGRHVRFRVEDVERWLDQRRDTDGPRPWRAR